MTDAYGDWTVSRDYYPYGEIRTDDSQGPAIDNRFGYTNKELDEETDSDLAYFEARYLTEEHDVGRFMSLDPWEGDYRDPQSLNKYAYARNNPVKYVDPTGENPVLVGGVAGGIVGFAAAFPRATLHYGASLANLAYGNYAAAEYHSGAGLNTIFSGTVSGAAGGAAGAIAASVPVVGVPVSGAAAGAASYTANALVSSGLESIGMGDGSSFTIEGVAISMTTGAAASTAVSVAGSAVAVSGWNSGTNSYKATSQALDTMYSNGNTANIAYTSSINQTIRSTYEVAKGGAQQVVGEVFNSVISVFGGSEERRERRAERRESRRSR